MSIRYLVGDVFERMAELKDDSVDLILTSPPFLALRSYLPADHPDKGKEIGNEATPAEYIDILLRLTAEWRRLLAPHGSLVVELGDTYSGTRPKGPLDAEEWGGDGGTGGWMPGRGNFATGGPGWPLAKSLTLIPESYRFALAYGINPHTGVTSPAGQWRVRNVIRWVRPNPPVGALGDKFRPATTELVVACLSGSRYFDLDAVRQPSNSTGGSTGHKGKTLDDRPAYENTGSHAGGAPPLDWWDVLVDRINQEIRDSYDRGFHQQDSLLDPMSEQAETPGQHLVRDLVKVGVLNDGDTIRLAPKGTKAAHYAVWPSELCVKPIKAMCPERVCRTCGEPSRRLVDYERHTSGDDIDYDIATGRTGGTARMKSSKGGTAVHIKRDTLGWSDCGHNDYRAGMVLDPFAGTGTTLAVAHGHGRDAIGIDIDARSAELARDRVGPLFLEVEYA